MRIFLIALGILALVAVIALLLAWPVMLLWNAVVPDIFGLPTVTFWQALGLNLLCGFMFRSGGEVKIK